MSTYRIDVLGSRIEIRAPDALTAALAVAFRRFVVADGGSAAHTVHAAADGSSIAVDGIAWPVVAEIDPVFQLYQRVVRLVLRHAGDQAVLHAGAVVDARGEAALIAAPSGHGKTTLTLSLLERGFRLLGDDYAPLDLATGRVHPFPRTVAVGAGARALVPRSISDAADSPTAVRFLGKSLVDPGLVLGEEVLASEPAPLRCVILLASRAAEGGGGVRVEVGTRLADGAWIDAALSELPGLSVVGRKRRGELLLVRVALDPSERPTPALSRILDDDRVLFSHKWTGEAPRFDASPRAEPLTRRLAAQHLASEMLNRHPDGALMRRYGGDATALFLDLAGALGRVDCWRVAPGPFRETVDLVARLVGNGAAVL